jgi:hypothetical protein
MHPLDTKYNKLAARDEKEYNKFSKKFTDAYMLSFKKEENKKLLDNANAAKESGDV